MSGIAGSIGGGRTGVNAPVAAVAGGERGAVRAGSDAVSSTGVPQRLQRTILGVVLLGIVAAVYAPALEGVFIWDDVALIEQNQHIKESGSARRALRSDLWDTPLAAESDPGSSATYYRPLVTLSYALDYRLHGLDARGFHLTNLVLHLLAVLALVLLLARLTRDPLAALLGGLLWALHPSKAEAVAWISGRCDLLMGLFVLLSLLLFWRALESRGARRAALAAAGWLLYAAAVLSKESAVALALLVPALDLLLCRERRERLRANLIAIHLPLLLGTIAYLVLRLSSLPPQSLRAVRRLWLFLQTAAHYGLLVANPYAPSALRGEARSLVQPEPVLVAVGAALTLGALALVATPLLRRAPRARFGLLFFALALAPVLNLRPLGIHYMVAERFLYLPLAGLAALAALLVATAARWQRAVAVALLGVLASSYAIASHRRAADFGDAERFWRRELERQPRSELAHAHLGLTLVRRGKLAAAEAVYLRAFQLQLGERSAAKALGSWQHALEVRLLRSSDGESSELERARAFLSGLLALESAAAPVRSCLGRQCVTVQPRSEGALGWVRAERANILVTLGAVASRLGDDDAAVRHLTESLALRPGRLAPLLNRALARLRARDLAGAEQDLAAVRAKLPDAREVRSLAETIRAAAPLLRALARFGPEPERSGEVEAQRLLAQLYIVAKAPRRAERALREVVRLAPGDGEARALLAYEVAILGRPAEARALIEAARRELGDSVRLRWVEAQIARPGAR